MSGIEYLIVIIFLYAFVGEHKPIFWGGVVLLVFTDGDVDPYTFIAALIGIGLAAGLLSKARKCT